MPGTRKTNEADRFLEKWSRVKLSERSASQSAIVAAAAKDERLKKRTLTNLYNDRPTWLKLAHETLDRAVLAAYAAVDPEGVWAEDWASVWVTLGRGRSCRQAIRSRRSDCGLISWCSLIR